MSYSTSSLRQRHHNHTSTFSSDTNHIDSESENINYDFSSIAKQQSRDKMQSEISSNTSLTSSSRRRSYLKQFFGFHFLFGSPADPNRITPENIYATANFSAFAAILSLVLFFACIHLNSVQKCTTLKKRLAYSQLQPQ